MKKLLLLLPVLAVAFTACNKDEENVEYNKFLIDGTQVEVVKGEIYHYGNRSDSSDEIRLSFANETTTMMWFNLYVPAGNTKPIAGTYTFEEDSDKEFTFPYGCTVAAGNDGYYELCVTGGTITIAVSGSTYTIAVNCNLENGGAAKGTYKGVLKRHDGTEA